MRALAERGDRVFLDLKFHDIPNTVAGAVASAVATGAWMVNVHASGGRRMMQAAADAAANAAARAGRERPLVIGVTVLTSLDDAQLRETGRVAPGRRPGRPPRAAGPGVRARRRGRLAAGDRGDPSRLRPGLPDRHARHPAVHRSGQPTTIRRGRWRRARRVAAGASYLVIGRPITAAADPRAAAEDIAAHL